MRWILKHNPTGKYINSKRVMVYSQNYARRFNSRKQARRYLCASGYDKKEVSVVGYYMDKSFAPRRLALPEIKKLVMRKMIERKAENIRLNKA